jgi:hypothetical protein
MDKIEELQDRIRQINLVISRVPKDTKTKFIELANAEYCGDYGMVLKNLVEEHEIYTKFKKMLFEDDIQLIIAKKYNSNSEQKTTNIKLCSGKVLKKEDKNG